MTPTLYPHSPGDIDDLLLVENNPRDIRFIEETFSTSPLEVTVHSVSSSDAAIHFLQRRGDYADAPEPDLVFVNWNLVEMTDDEVVTTLQTDYSQIPLVILTVSRTRVPTSHSSRADLVTEKPTDLEGYIEIVRAIAPGQ
ncbi:response regulator [Natrialbaceae archaeon GCM10025810]|uniref:response regulator n=1 Tax=Halovalidus salilacus TaxID=3075124 RepID=UPI0036171741